MGEREGVPQTKAAPPALRYLDPEEARAFRGPDGSAYVTIRDEMTVIGARFMRVCPLTDPDRYLAIVGPDPNGRDFGLLRNWRRLDAASREVVAAELQRRYLHPTVKRILSVKDYYGVAVCTFETDRGVREVTLRDVQDNAIYLGPSRVLLTDAEGNRFDIPDIAALDPTSRALLAEIL